jgi:hypothetical protein
MNVKFPNNTSKWQIEFNSAFKGLKVIQDNIQRPQKNEFSITGFAEPAEL